MAWPGLRDSERDRDSEFGATAAGPGHPDRRALGRRAARARHVAGAADDTDSRLVYCRSIRRSTRGGAAAAAADSARRTVTRRMRDSGLSDSEMQLRLSANRRFGPRRSH